MPVFCLILDSSDLDCVMAMRAYTRDELPMAEGVIADSLYSTRVDLEVSLDLTRVKFRGSAEKQAFLAWARKESGKDLERLYSLMTNYERHLFNDKYMECLTAFGH